MIIARDIHTSGELWLGGENNGISVSLRTICCANNNKSGAFSFCDQNTGCIADGHILMICDIVESWICTRERVDDAGGVLPFC